MHWELAQHMKTVFMYSGQGSQYYQMGADLYASAPGFRRQLDSLDQIVREHFGWSVIDIVYDLSKTKIDPFREIDVSSAAIFMLEVCLTRHLRELGIKPDYLLGVSLGTFAAAETAGCYRAEDYLSKVIKAAQITRDTSPEGAMIAVLSHPEVLSTDGYMPGLCELAAVNFEGHFTISTLRENVARVTERLRQSNINYLELPISRPYHARWLDGSKDSLKAFHGAIDYGLPLLPLICSAACGPIDRFGVDEIWRVAREPIWFAKTALALDASKGPCRYIDIGPSGTLATFMKYLLPKTSRSEIVSLMSPMQNTNSNLQRLLSSRQAV